MVDAVHAPRGLWNVGTVLGEGLGVPPGRRGARWGRPQGRAAPPSRASVPRPPPVGSPEAIGLCKGALWGHPLGPLLAAPFLYRGPLTPRPGQGLGTRDSWCGCRGWPASAGWGGAGLRRLVVARRPLPTQPASQREGTAGTGKHGGLPGPPERGHRQNWQSRRTCRKPSLASAAGMRSWTLPAEGLTPEASSQERNNEPAGQLTPPRAPRGHRVRRISTSLDCGRRRRTRRWWRAATRVDWSSLSRVLSLMGACVHARSLQLCPTLWDHMDCRPPGSSVHGISQARTVEWVAISSSKDTFACCLLSGLLVTTCCLCLIFLSVCLTLDSSHSHAALSHCCAASITAKDCRI